MNTEEKIPPLSWAEAEPFYAAVVGPKRGEYYLPRFRRWHEAGGMGASWNWSAFGCMTLPWLLFRRLNGIAGWYFIGYLMLSQIFSAVSPMVFTADPVAALLAEIAVEVLYFLVLGSLYANAAYYWQIGAWIRKLRVEGVPLSEMTAPLAQKGGVAWWPPLLFIVAVTLVTLFQAYRIVMAL